MRDPLPLDPDRVRKIPKSFSWIDRRLVTGNFLPYLSKDEIVLYFFLVTVSNRHGMSFYGPRKICFALGLTREELNRAIEGLKKLDLVAFRYPFYQVLALPNRPVQSKEALQRIMRRRSWK